MTLKRKSSVIDADEETFVKVFKLEEETKEPTSPIKGLKGILKKKTDSTVVKQPVKKITIKNPSNKTKNKKGIKPKVENKKITGIKNKKADDDKKKEASPTKKENLSKKARKTLYKSTKNNYEIITKAKKLWEVLRNSANKTKSEEVSKQLHNLIKGKVNQLVYAHDTSRIVECLLSLAPESIKCALFNELKDEIILMSKSKYAKFVAQKLLSYGTKEQRSYIISSFSGQIVKLMKHTEAASVIEAAYNEYANASQRASMVEAFYGATYPFYKTPESPSLEMIMKNADKKLIILEFMKKALLDVTAKPVMCHSLIHKILYDYLQHSSETSRDEMITVIRENVVQILHSRDGSRVGMKCVWHGNAKDRKVLVKSFKSHVLKICKEKHGHLVLLAMFDSIDDTKLVHNIIVKEILTNLKEIIVDPLGRKVILYLLSPRDKLNFHPDVIRILDEGDSNTVSKKDKDIRSKELLSFVAVHLLNYVTENAKELMFNSSANIVFQAVLRHCPGDKQKAFEAISQIVAEPYTKGIGDNTHVIEHTAGHLFLKHLLQEDKRNIEESKSGVTFAETLLEKIPAENFKDWIGCNRGTFILISLLDTGIKSVTSQIKNSLKSAEGKLSKKTFPGANILLQKLS